MKIIFLLLLMFSFAVDAVPPPRGIDPVEAKKRERKQRIEKCQSQNHELVQLTFDERGAWHQSHRNASNLESEIGVPLSRSLRAAIEP